MNAQELLSENVYAHDEDDLIGYGIADTEDPFFQHTGISDDQDTGSFS